MQILQLLAHRYVLHLYVRKVIKIGTLGYTDRESNTKIQGVGLGVGCKVLKAYLLCFV